MGRRLLESHTQPYTCLEDVPSNDGYYLSCSNSPAHTEKQPTGKIPQTATHYNSSVCNLYLNKYKSLTKVLYISP